MDRSRREEIARRLVEWYNKEGKRLPWRMEGLRPYDILMAEMMLQKTRANMVARAYSSFLERYPNFQSLAFASVKEIAQILKPLGLYNRRARWMKAIAETIVKKYAGKLPRKRETLLALPGLGMYNANAILCFACNKAVPLVDVNVARVLGRVASIKVSGDLRRNKELYDLASQLVPEKNFKEFNWALLDLGSTICTPKNPKHNVCPIASLCEHALRQKAQKKSFRILEARRVSFDGGQNEEHC